MKIPAALFIALLAVFSAFSQNTTRKVIPAATGSDTVPVIAESLVRQSSGQTLFKPDKIRISGFEKRVSDSQESFFITNNTGYRISRILIKLQYYDIDGRPIHHRERTVECELDSGDTRQVNIPSFDRHRRYYYRNGPKPKRSAIPFGAAYEILRYDIIAEPDTH